MRNIHNREPATIAEGLFYIASKARRASETSSPGPLSCSLGAGFQVLRSAPIPAARQDT